MSLRVVQLVGSLACERAGRGATTVAAGLNRAEFDPHVVALQGGPMAEELGRLAVATTTAARRGQFRSPDWWRLRKSISQLRADVIHVWPSAGTAGRAAACLAGVGRVIVGHEAPSASEPWFAPLEDLQLRRRAAALVVDCQAVADAWRARDWPQEKVRVVPPAAAVLGTSVLDRQQLLDELGLPRRVWLVGAIGPLVLRERVKDLVWSTDLLKVIRDDVHLLVIGDGPHRQRLERYARLCRILDKVHFLGCRPDLPSILPHFNLVWRGGGRAGLPQEIVQAMAAGVPVVAAEAPGMAELVIHEETGFLVPVGDRAGLARYANKIIEQPDLAARLGAAARQRIATQFTPQAMVDKHAAVYREVCG